MRVAFVHDWLVHYGGAEKVFADIIAGKMLGEFKGEKKIFTLFATRPTLTMADFGYDPMHIEVEKVWTPGVDYRYLLPLFPLGMKILRQKLLRYKPDLIVTSSFAVAKNHGLGGLLYLHSPMQYIRDSYEEYEEKFSGIKKSIFQRVATSLRTRDKKYIAFDDIFVNSRYTGKVAKKIYGIETKVVYPLVETSPFTRNPGEYFLVMGRLVTFSRHVDTIIEVCTELEIPLKVAGTGPDENYLRSIAGPTIEFVGRVSGEEKWKLLSESKGIINITKESFGIVTKEAVLAGVPVLGVNYGATPELLDGYRRGMCIENCTKSALVHGLREFVHKVDMRSEGIK